MTFALSPAPDNRTAGSSGFASDNNLNSKAIQALNTYVTGQLPIDLGEYGPFGDGTDTSDDTVLIQSALDDASAQKRPLRWRRKATPYRVGPLTVGAGTEIWIEPGTVVRAIPGLGDNDRLVNIVDVDDVSISGYGAVFEGTGDYTTGEQRHIFHVRGAKTVLLEGMAANDSGGDGFYIGRTTGVGRLWSEDVTLRDVSADGNRRQGLSIISAVNLLVDHPRMTNTAGTAPECGIDVEPNSADEVLRGVRIVNPYTQGNARAGVLVVLNALDATSEPVDVRVEYPHSRSDAQGFRATKTSAARGRVVCADAAIHSSGQAGIYARNWQSPGAELVIERPEVVNCARVPGGSAALDSGISVHAAAGDVGTARIGNVRIVEPTIVNDIDAAMTRYVWVQDQRTTPAGAEKVTVTNPRRLEGAALHALGVSSQPDNAGDLRIIDPLEVLARQFTAAETLTPDKGVSLCWTAADNTNTRIITLSDRGFAGPIRFERRGATAGIRIQPHTGGQILPLAGVDKYVQLDTAGSSLVLLRRGNDWFARDVVGTVTAQA